jgi:hypothetical protein
MDQLKQNIQNELEVEKDQEEEAVVEHVPLTDLRIVYDILYGE